LEESEEHSSSDYSVTGTAKGDIEIAEADPQGRFVKLANKGNKVNTVRNSWSVLMALNFAQTVIVNVYFTSILTSATGDKPEWLADYP